MRQFADIIRVQTRGRGLVEVTRSVADWANRMVCEPDS